jgi:hypothetical protein
VSSPPWGPGSATGVGSLPGDDPHEAARLVFGELADFPHLPELPGRGPGADMVGRAGALLVDIHLDLQPSGWRLIDRGGMDERRARDYLARDLDALEVVADGYEGPLKLQVVGPWTLTAALERARGDRPLADAGARTDIAASLAEGVAGQVADVRRRVPGANICVQLDEPSLAAVLTGRVGRASGRGTLPPIESPDVVAGLRTVIGAVRAAGGVPLVHCCARRPPIALAREAGAEAVSVDAAMLASSDDDAIGEGIEAGMTLFLGLVPALGPGVPPPVREVVAPARGLWARLGFAPERLGASVVVTPACGLAGASSGWVRTALRLVRQAGQVLVEAPE